MMDDLERQFPRTQIFRDLDSIEAGTDFVEAIEKAVGQSVVLLAVIGPRWLTAVDAGGARRLDAPGDFVRQEIAAALRRKIRLIPVLVDGCAPPKASELPEELAALARLQTHELSDKRWDYDVEQLLDILERIPGLTREPPTSVATASRRGKKLGARAALLLVALACAVVVAVGFGALRPSAAADDTEKRRLAENEAKTAAVPSVGPTKSVEPPKPAEAAPTQPTASATPVRLRLALAHSKAPDGGWPVYDAVEQVGGNGTDRHCRIHPEDDVVVTCRHERAGKKTSLVLRLEGIACAGFITSDAFVQNGMLPQKKLSTLPACP